MNKMNELSQVIADNNMIEPAECTCAFKIVQDNGAWLMRAIEQRTGEVWFSWTLTKEDAFDIGNQLINVAQSMEDQEEFESSIRASNLVRKNQSRRTITDPNSQA